MRFLWTEATHLNRSADHRTAEMRLLGKILDAPVLKAPQGYIRNGVRPDSVILTRADLTILLEKLNRPEIRQQLVLLNSTLR